MNKVAISIASLGVVAACIGAPIANFAQAVEIDGDEFTAECGVIQSDASDEMPRYDAYCRVRDGGRVATCPRIELTGPDDRPTASEIADACERAVLDLGQRANDGGDNYSPPN